MLQIAGFHQNTISPFDQVTHSNLYEYSPKKSNTASGMLGGVIAPAIFIAILGFVFNNG